ncbi:MAG: FMN-binding protein [Geothrix sp.]|nr:FMN-binding protein [Geothrix sp.]
MNSELKALALFLSGAALVQALPAQHEALTLAFPECTFVRKDCYPTPAQAAQAEALAGGKLPGLWYVAYEAWKDGKLQGVAFFDTHRVRTENETAMVAVGQDGRLRRVEVVAFREPPDYAPKAAWLGQFQGRALDGELTLKRAIRPLSGATLTANALLDASRRGLALWKVYYG